MRHSIHWLAGVLVLTPALEAADPVPVRSSNPWITIFPASQIETIYLPAGTPLLHETRQARPKPMPPIGELPTPKTPAGDERIGDLIKRLDQVQTRLQSLEKLVIIHDDQLRERLKKP